MDCMRAPEMFTKSSTKTKVVRFFDKLEDEKNIHTFIKSYLFFVSADACFDSIKIVE